MKTKLYFLMLLTLSFSLRSESDREKENHLLTVRLNKDISRVISESTKFKKVEIGGWGNRGINPCIFERRSWEKNSEEQQTDYRSIVCVVPTLGCFHLPRYSCEVTFVWEGRVENAKPEDFLSIVKPNWISND
jgi:hypothetical protein